MAPSVAGKASCGITKKRTLWRKRFVGVTYEDEIAAKARKILVS
jgi:hypothetical protein